MLDHQHHQSRLPSLHLPLLLLQKQVHFVSVKAERAPYRHVTHCLVITWYHHMTGGAQPCGGELVGGAPTTMTRTWLHKAVQISSRRPKEKGTRKSARVRISQNRNDHLVLSTSVWRWRKTKKQKKKTEKRLTHILQLPRCHRERTCENKET